MLRSSTKSLTRRALMMAKPSPQLGVLLFCNFEIGQRGVNLTRAFSSYSPQKETDSGDKKSSSSKSEIVLRGIKVVGVTVKGWIMNPRQTWQSIKDEAHHYWVGSKLLWSEIKVTKQILGRVVQGHELTRRERKQLVRTSTDLFRLIPFAIIVVIPFMELLLPVLLKVFPNMLPSTFEVRTCWSY